MKQALRLTSAIAHVTPSTALQAKLFLCGTRGLATESQPCIQAPAFDLASFQPIFLPWDRGRRAGDELMSNAIASGLRSGTRASVGEEAGGELQKATV